MEQVDGSDRQFGRLGMLRALTPKGRILRRHAMLKHGLVCANAKWPEPRMGLCLIGLREFCKTRKQFGFSCFSRFVSLLNESDITCPFQSSHEGRAPGFDRGYKI